MNSIRLLWAFLLVSTSVGQISGGNWMLTNLPNLIKTAQRDAAQDPTGQQVNLLQQLVANTGVAPFTNAEVAAASLRATRNPLLRAVGMIGSQQGLRSIRLRDNLEFDQLPPLAIIIAHLAPVMSELAHRPIGEADRGIIEIFHASIDFAQAITQPGVPIETASPPTRVSLLIRSFEQVASQLPDGSDKQATLIAISALKGPHEASQTSDQMNRELAPATTNLPLITHDPLKPKVSTAKAHFAKSDHRESEATQWPLVIVMIAAATGLLWLSLKRRS
jgi:hypothetical protein